MRDRITGIFLGTAVGDALGLPVETYTPEKIARIYPGTNGRINQYIAPTGHKWFDGRKPGTTTDDTQLTLAVAKGLMASHGLVKHTAMAQQVQAHVDAYQETTGGWGGTTRQAVKALFEGKPWEQSGINNEGKGKGNGVIMKLAPAAVRIFSKIKDYHNGEEARKRILMDGFCFIRDLTLMTHRTEMAICASFAHTVAIFECLGNDFVPERFIERVIKASEQGVKWAKSLRLPKETDSITQALTKLRDYKTMDQEQAIKEWGGGSCYCFHSLPFTYYWFLRNPENIESLYDCVSAGGDADSNGSMLAAMLGARHGPNVFPPHLVGENLDKSEELLELAENYCNEFLYE